MQAMQVRGLFQVLFAVVSAVLLLAVVAIRVPAGLLNGKHHKLRKSQLIQITLLQKKYLLCALAGISEMVMSTQSKSLANFFKNFAVCQLCFCVAW
jgi:hypothetical protein